MAGTLTITDQNIGGPTRPVRKVTLAWVATAGGAVSGNYTDYLSGEIVRVVFDPGSPAPTNAYDVTLLDESGIDLLAGQGGNLSDTATTHVVPGVPLKDGTTTSTMPVQVDDKLQLVVANAGSGGAGAVILYMR